MGDGEALVLALERGREVDTFSIADMRSMLAFSTPRVVAYLDGLRERLAVAKAELLAAEEQVRVLEEELGDG